MTDTGVGMDEGTLKRIFEPFFTTKEVGKGTGLGLPTAHGIIKQHQGWIEVRSQPEHGSTFEVYLPAKVLQPVSTEPPSASAIVLGGRGTLLLVEDEEIVRRPIGIYLRKLGYHVIEAANGNQAFSLWRLHRERIDLLYTDMVMPEGVTGLELAEKLKSEKPQLQGHHLQRLQHRNQHARRADRRRLCVSAQAQPLRRHRGHHPRLSQKK